MYGNLNEIDIRSILQLISLGQRTGQLFVEARSCHNSNQLSVDEVIRQGSWSEFKQQSWYLFFLNGKIIYCQDSDSSLTRIADYLRHYRVQTRLDKVQLGYLETLNAPEYNYLWTLLERNIIQPKVAQTIIHGLVHETLFDLLSLHQGSFIFDLGSAFAPQLTTLEIAPLVTKIMKQMQEWKLLYPHIQSPDQFPVLADITELRSSLPSSTVNKLQQWVDGKTSLRQLARYLNRDVLTVAKAIYPYVQQGCVHLVYSSTSKVREIQQRKQELLQKARIVCIDDTATICESVESILKPLGYEAIAFTNPLEAIACVFQIKPNLILCDITMPELDGYEICGMLRHSTAFRLVPIIMLSSKNAFIDRVRARMVGACDYLTKPFTDTELLMLVEKYLNYSLVWRHNRDVRLVDSIPDRVKDNITESAGLGTGEMGR
jgi:twitching motility two-component system response regulator PilG